jgi:cell wall-associated NlpC family hydrolase
MTTATDPEPGDFAVVSVGGTPGRLIGLGERLNGAAAFSEYQHAFIYVGNGQVVQAEPAGAAYASVSPHTKTLWSSGRIPLTASQRSAISRAARGYVGTPYSALDYLAIALHHWHLPIPHLRGYIASTGHMICSQLVDRCYQDAGVQLFADERWNGYVTPADLARLVAS